MIAKSKEKNRVLMGVIGNKSDIDEDTRNKKLDCDHDLHFFWECFMLFKVQFFYVSSMPDELAEMLEVEKHNFD